MSVLQKKTISGESLGKPGLRVHSIDAVRATALFCILMIHCYQSFAAGAYTEPLWNCDPCFPEVVNKCVGLICAKVLKLKFLMVFTFLFGLSFYFQMNNAAKRGIDFRARFCLRLFWLFLFGLLHVSFYCDDVLTLFAVLGLGLVFIWKLPTGFIACACLLFLLQPIKIVEIVLGNGWSMHEFVNSIVSICPLFPAENTDCSSIALNNISGAWLRRWVHWELPSGRLSATIGMFLLGVLAGKSRIFEQKQGKILCATLCGGLIYSALIIIYYYFVNQYAETGNESLHQVIDYMKWICSEGSLLFIVPFFAWLYGCDFLQKLIVPVKAIGRCTLTCYITQGIVMVWFFYPWGLGMYGKLDVTSRCLVGVILFVAQMTLCAFWLKKFKYGPLEGVWRKLTRLGMEKK